MDLGEVDSQGYENFIEEFSTLVFLCPPPFIYIYAPTSLRTACSVVDKVIRTCGSAYTTRIHHARINAISCLSARLLYDSILNALASWEASWEDGCACWTAQNESQRWNENTDTFLHGLQALYSDLAANPQAGSSKIPDQSNIRFVIVIERAEKLKGGLSDLIVPLTRLAELSRLDLTVVFLSEVLWEDMKPPLGASPDPFFMDVVPLKKEAIIQRLIATFTKISQDYHTSQSNSMLAVYHPSLLSLYSHFVTVLFDICFPFTHDLQELSYIAAARWPGFARPVLDDHQRKMASRLNGLDEPTLELLQPSDKIRMRLTRLFKPSLSTALDVLYPRITNAADWAAVNEPGPDILANLPGSIEPNKGINPPQHDGNLKTLPRMSKFLLVAAYLASTNPSKSDLRMFGRGLDEKKRKRRAVRAAGKTKSGPAKLPQRLVGPTTFPLDRMIAVLGALLEENDVDTRLPMSRFKIPGEYTDMEIGRVGIYSSIMELTAMRFLYRTSQADKLDGPPMFKCSITYDLALALARQLGIPLNDLLWDPL